MKPLHLQIDVTFDEEAMKSVAELIRAVLPKPDPEEQRRQARLQSSQNALFKGQKPPEDQGLLLDIKETAKLLKVGERTLWGLVNDKKILAPIRIGRSMRWSLDGLKAWIAAGGPVEN